MDRTAFWNRIAKKYAASPISDEAAYKHKLELTQARMTPETEALEFGCGTGGTARAAPTSSRSERCRTNGSGSGTRGNATPAAPPTCPLVCVR